MYLYIFMSYSTTKILKEATGKLFNVGDTIKPHNNMNHAANAACIVHNHKRFPICKCAVRVPILNGMRKEAALLNIEV